MKLKNILLLAILFLVFRACLLLTHVEIVSEREELYRGSIAQEFLSGLRRPAWDYQPDSYSSGSVAVGALAAAFFKFLGPSLFALKLAPLTFAFLTLLLLYYFMRKHFGERTAVFASFFYIFSPPLFARLSLAAMGYHSESIFFSMLILILYDLRKFFLCGLVSALGIWFTPITFITVLTVVIAWGFIEPVVFRNGRKVFALGLGVGLIPWAVYNLTHELEGVRFMVRALLIGRSFFESGGGNFFAARLLKVFNLFFGELPLSFGFPDIGKIPRYVFNYTYFMLLLFCIAGGISTAWQKVKSRDAGSRAIIPLLLFSPLYLLVFFLSGVDAKGTWWPYQPLIDNARYFIPMHFFLFALMAVLAGFSRRRGAFWLLLLMGFAGQGSYFFKEPVGRAFYYRGYSYEFLGGVEGQIWPHRFVSFADYLNSLQSLPADKQFHLIRGAAHGLQFEKTLSPEMGRRILEKSAPENRMSLIQGLGYAVGVQRGLTPSAQSEWLALFLQMEEQGSFYRGLIDGVMSNEAKIEDRLADYAAFAEQIPETSRQWIYSAIGFVAAYSPSAAEKAGPLLKAMDENAQKSFYRGAGMRAASNWIEENVSILAGGGIPLKIPDRWEKDFYYGMGWCFGQKWPEDDIRARDWAGKIPLPHRVQVIEGLMASK